GHRVARALDTDDDAIERLLVLQLEVPGRRLIDGAGILVFHHAGLQRNGAVVVAGSLGVDAGGGAQTRDQVPRLNPHEPCVVDRLDVARSGHRIAGARSRVGTAAVDVPVDELARRIGPIEAGDVVVLFRGRVVALVGL